MNTTAQDLIQAHEDVSAALYEARRHLSVLVDSATPPLTHLGRQYPTCGAWVLDRREVVLALEAEVARVQKTTWTWRNLGDGTDVVHLFEGRMPKSLWKMALHSSGPLNRLARLFERGFAVEHTLIKAAIEESWSLGASLGGANVKAGAELARYLEKALAEAKRKAKTPFKFSRKIA